MDSLIKELLEEGYTVEDILRACEEMKDGDCSKS